MELGVKGNIGGGGGEYKEKVLYWYDGKDVTEIGQ